MLSHDLNFFANCELHDKTSDELVEIWKNFLGLAKIFFFFLIFRLKLSYFVMHIQIQLSYAFMQPFQYLIR